jgi:hypothetical protein
MLPHDQPLALPLVQSEGFCRHQLGRLLVQCLDKAQEYAPVFNERDGPASGLLLGRALGYANATWTEAGVESPRHCYGPSKISGALKPCLASADFPNTAAAGSRVCEARKLRGKLYSHV